MAAEEVTVSSCLPCRCFGRRRKSSSFDNPNIFHDADDGRGLRLVDDPFLKDGSLHYFDALEEEKTSEELYPIITTNYKRKRLPNVSFEQPETLLREYHSDAKEEITVLRPSAFQPGEEEEEKEQRRKSSGIVRLLRRPTAETKKFLESPRIKIEERGYPGELSVEELGIAQRFVRELKTRDVRCAEQVYSYRDIEDDAFAICRWMRGLKFDVEKNMERLEMQKEMWDNAKAHDFFPDVSKAIRAPYSVFLTQYPFIAMGNAKNGCPVNYFRAGRINPEGILCLTTCELVEGYFWNSFMHTFKRLLRKAQDYDPDMVRCEGINVIDLEGLSSSAITKDTFDVVTLAGKIADFFPETLHCMLILNAPSFFSMVWPVIKKLVDPRTAKRIHVFSNKQKGFARLSEMIDLSEMPSDYGGKGTTIARAIIEQGGLSSKVNRQEVQLLHIKKRSHVKHTIELQTDETMEIQIFTRSASNASFVVYQDKDPDSTIIGSKEVSSKPSIEEDGAPLPFFKDIGTISGPGCFTLEGSDLDTATKKQSSFSRGYYLFVGTVM